MRSLLFPVLLLGCAEAPSESMPEQSPPPFTPVLSVGAMVPGETVDFTVVGAPVGSTTTFVLSTDGLGGGPCPGFLLGRCLDVAPPVRVLPSVITDDSATLSLTVPSGISPRPVWVQAVSVINGVGVKSSVVQRYIGDADEDLILDTEDNCPGIYNPYQIDDDFDGSGAACDCDDNDPVSVGACSVLNGQASIIVPSPFPGGAPACDVDFDWTAQEQPDGSFDVEGLAPCGVFGDMMVTGSLSPNGDFVGDITGLIPLVGEWTATPTQINVDAIGDVDGVQSVVTGFFEL